jgi:hypothetical protein
MLDGYIKYIKHNILHSETNIWEVDIINLSINYHQNLFYVDVNLIKYENKDIPHFITEVKEYKYTFQELNFN